MKYHILTLFPEMMQGLSPSIIGRAAEKNIITLETVNIRDYTLDRHKKVDDYPYGGGAGMLMQAQPVFDAHRAAAGGKKVRTIYVTPQGEQFTQQKAKELACEEELIFLCGHYEGIDERVLEEIVTDYISIGDYVLTGGELAAMVMIDAITRLIPDVLGNEASAEEESFYNDLLEYPQYSRPEVWHGKKVPEVLLSGNHSRIMSWRLEQSIERTMERRPDLYEKYRKKQHLIKLLSKEKRNNIHMMESLARGRSEILYAEGEDVLLYDREYKICILSSKKAIKRIPEDAELVISQERILEAEYPSEAENISAAEYLPDVEEISCCECVQMLYTRKTALPVKHKKIKKLAMDSFHYVSARCGESGEYVEERIRAGAIYGIFAEESGGFSDAPAGFIGICQNGSLGMLYVEERWRRQGYAQSLAAYAANRMLEKGWTPYSHTAADNEAAVRLQENMGFYQAQKALYIYKKVLANDFKIC